MLKEIGSIQTLVLMIQLDYSEKKDRLDKERHGIWSRDLHTVEDIIEHDGQQLYKIRGYNKQFARSEILLVEDG